MFYITTKVSKSGNEYQALIHSANGKETFISFDRTILCRVSGRTLKELINLPVDEIIEIE